jgi:Tetratricopeptide repeat
VAEAEPFYRRALAIYEKSFGPEHPNVATGLNNLAEPVSAFKRCNSGSIPRSKPVYHPGCRVWVAACDAAATRVRHGAMKFQPPANDEREWTR